MPYEPRDRFYKKAKQEGYRSRAAYKLIELQQRFRIIRPGDVVVDLGAAPGGWLQVAAQLVGPTGKAVGIDLQPIRLPGEKNVVVLQGDVTSEEMQEEIERRLGRKADCVLSDLAPKLSGIPDADAARSLELNLTALRVAARLLKPGGHFLVKSFTGGELENFVAEMKKYFRTVQRSKPEATRRGSAEIYLCGKSFVGRQKI